MWPLNATKVCPSNWGAARGTAGISKYYVGTDQHNIFFTAHYFQHHCTTNFPVLTPFSNRVTYTATDCSEWKIAFVLAVRTMQINYFRRMVSWDSLGNLHVHCWSNNLKKTLTSSAVSVLQLLKSGTLSLRLFECVPAMILSAINSRPTTSCWPSNPLSASSLAPQILLWLTIVRVYKLYLLLDHYTSYFLFFLFGRLSWFLTSFSMHSKYFHFYY